MPDAPTGSPAPASKNEPSLATSVCGLSLSSCLFNSSNPFATNLDDLQKLEASAADLRRLVLAVRRATGLIKTDPDKARKIWFAHTRTSRPFLARLNPLTTRARMREARVARDTFEATLPAFVNDNTLAQEYWSALAAWLVETGQIDGDPVAPSVYWTNGLAL